MAAFWKKAAQKLFVNWARGDFTVTGQNRQNGAFTETREI
jgi:hypothetical protein